MEFRGDGLSIPILRTDFLKQYRFVLDLSKRRLVDGKLLINTTPIKVYAATSDQLVEEIDNGNI